MLKEFRTFALRGNVIDLAVGVIIGAAFGKITTSLVNDVIMPPIGLLLGRVDFSDLFVDLSGASYPSLTAAKDAGAPVIAYGAFVNTIIEFTIIAFAVFMLVRQVNRLQARFKDAPAPATEKNCPRCVSAIPIAATKCKFCTSDL
ncbi:MAG: large conductance mechanosensitive channel protein MscL [Proteobacteria bacterium]|nr:large conductance mechanosensitive channel protein MscL [Pseudomonadota bacterium]